MSNTNLKDNWQAVCQVSDLSNNIGVCALLDEQQVAIFKLSNGDIFAIDNYDPFSNVNVLSRGICGDLNGQFVVASPIYKQHFNLETGQCLEDDTVCLSTYQVRVVDGVVELLADMVKTTCPYCGVGCGVIAKKSFNNIVSVKGDKNHPANFGRLCSKGAALDETIDLEHRLLHPSINNQQVNWDEALSKVAESFTETIEKYGPDSVAFYVSGQLLTEDYYLANKLMKGFIGSANIDTNSRLCMSSAVAGHKRAFGNDTVALCYDDLEEAEAIIITGSNLAWCHPVLYQRIEKAKAETGAKLYVIDPRQTATCDLADEHLAIKPGTDAILYNGLLSYLAENNAIDTDYISAYTKDYEATLIAAKETAPDLETVAQLCELDEEKVLAFCRLFIETEKVISLFSMGINQSTSGVDKVNCIINTHLASGKIGKPGMGAYSITGQPNAMGGREVGGLSNTLAAHMDFAAEDKDRVQRFWKSDRIAEQPGLKAVDLFNDIHSGKVKALWVMATNPAVSLPNADLVNAALEKCEFLVVSDCIQETDTTRYADVLLPAQAWAEKDGTVTNSERRISRQRAFLAPAGEAKADWWIISEVAKRMGFSEQFSYEKVSDIFREHAALSGFENEGQRDFDISLFANLEHQQYQELQPIQWPVNEANPQGTKRLLQDGKFYTADGKAKFIPIKPMPPKEELSEAYPLILNTGRIRDHWHTMTRTAKSQRLSKHIKEPYVQLHPETAARFDIEQNSLAEISSQWGQVIVRAEITDGQRKNELFIPLHWNDQFSAKARVDAVVNPHVDELSGQPEYKHTPVSIQSVQHPWHGFILTRHELKLNQFAYWSKIREQNNWRYELSDTKQHDLDSFKNLIQNHQDFDWVEYKDTGTNSERYFWFDESGLQGCAFTAASYDNLPAREWLSEEFNEISDGIQQRVEQLSTMSLDELSDPGSIICACFNIGKNVILNYIHEAQPDNIELIGKAIKAGTNCGSCRPELMALLEENASQQVLS